MNWPKTLQRDCGMHGMQMTIELGLPNQVTTRRIPHTFTPDSRLPDHGFRTHTKLSAMHEALRCQSQGANLH
jgi:hypothetical protein